jgi:predicted SprT family Zn-dependent metalloprotease
VREESGTSMQISDARELARGLMARHGLGTWRLVFDNAKTRAGVCRPGRREIGLSRVLTALHSEAEVRDTVLHEIAHALVGAEHGHGAVWKAKAVEIGCTPTRCLPETAARAAAAWTGTCPAGHVTTRHRQPIRVQSCGRCSRSFEPQALVEWQLHGETVPMHPSYVAELARITAAQGSLLPNERVPAAQPRRAPAPVLAVGAQVRLGGRGRYAGLTGTVEKRGRTRYHVRTPIGLVAAPFALVRTLREVG